MASMGAASSGVGVFSSESLAFVANKTDKSRQTSDAFCLSQLLDEYKTAPSLVGVAAPAKKALPKLSLSPSGTARVEPSSGDESRNTALPTTHMCVDMAWGDGARANGLPK